MLAWELLVILLSTVTAKTGPPAYVYPEHVHLSYGDSPLQMVVTWVTYNYTSSVVEYGHGSLSSLTYGTTTTFYDKTDTGRKWYIHRVTLDYLKPATKYFYHCGSNMSWSDLFYFTARRTDVDWSPWLAVYGDMGSENGQSIPRLQEEVVNGTLDVILHIGDFAYDLNSDHGRVGDAFMQQIEPIAAYVPYMTSVGNHEHANNFTHYKQRFTMPGSTQGMWYSYNLGRAHIISLSTEVYDYGTVQQAKVQLNWLKEDLANANRAENRAKQPWIIVLGHRPMYCATTDQSDCNYITNPVRLAFEPILYEQGVDLTIWAHEHEYERMYPLYKYTVCNSSSGDPYKEPTAPLHIVTGSAGCVEKHDGFKPKPPYVAVNILDYGYTRLRVINSTHLYFEQISDVQGGLVVDKVMVQSSKHGPGIFTCHKQEK